jgi:hypothetical protein
MVTVHVACDDDVVEHWDGNNVRCAHDRLRRCDVLGAGDAAPDG